MPYIGLTGKSLLAGITLSSGMGFILFGYDNGVVGGLLTAPDFMSTFALSSSMEGTVTSVFELGCFVGCLLTAFLGDRFGRRALAHVGTLVITAGAALQAAAFGVPQLVVGRVVAGAGLGLISSNVAIWQSETAPARVRGMLVACSLSFLIVGQLVAYWFDYGVSGYVNSVSWRLPIAFQAVLALIMSAMLTVMPESPRWLMTRGRTEEAAVVFRALKPDSDAAVIAREVAEVDAAIALEAESQKGWRELLKRDRVNSRRRVLLACGLNLMQDLSGSTPISLYTTFIFEKSVGFSRHMALLMSGFLQVWFLVASFATGPLIERVGRRCMFMISSAGMSAVMIVLAAMLAIGTHTGGIVAAVMIFAYQSFYTWGFMGSVWVYGPEILPLEYRSKGTGLATATLWIFAFVVIQIVPISLTNITWQTYIIFAVFNLCFIPIIYFFYPETSGFSLEMIDLAFMDDAKGAVKRAKELQKIMKAGQNLTLQDGEATKDGGAMTAYLEDVGTGK